MPKQIGSIDLKKSGYVLESKTQYAISNTGSAPVPSSIAWTDVMPTVAELSLDSTNKLYARQCNLINGTLVPGPAYDANMLDGLALFTNTVANKDANNNYTSINGSTITTGKIQDTSHKNFIQVAADSTYPAGHMEFKDTANWSDAHQGLQWDSAQGELNIKGNISANSLTIINGNNSYDGTAAINISGYDIEIVKDSVDVQEDVSVYLYPVLYHNGEKVPDYIQSADTSVDSSKTYYTRSGSAGSYVYTEVTNPSGNPSQIPYYEKQIDYSHFLWYQDDSEIGTAGDANNRGRYLATYGHNYRVTYDFDDGAVGGATEVQTRYVDPEKYITKVNDTEITIHPESYQNVSSYMRLGTSGLNIYNSSGNSIAQYGSTARVGLNDSSRFLMNNNSLQAYDDNNVKYFEVSSSGLTWGSQAAATTQQVSNLSSQLAGKANTSDVTQAVSDLEDAIDLKADSADVPTSVTDLSDGANYSTTSQMNTAIGSAVSGKANIEDIPTSVTDLSDGANYSTTNQMNNAIGAAVVGKADIEDVPTSVTDLSDGADYSTTTQMNTAIGAAETRAAKTATNYISIADNNGITIHSNDDNNERNILINSNEISIRNGLLPMMTLDNDSLNFNMINPLSDTCTNVASFGSLVRVGKESNAPKVVIQDDDFAIYTEDGNIAFETYVPADAPVAEQEVTKTYSASTYPIDGAIIETSSSYVSSNTITISDVTSIPTGTNFTLRINLVSDSRWTMDYGDCEFYFIRGTSSTQHDSVNNLGAVTGPGVDTSGVNCSLSVQYNGSNTFVITGSYVLANTNESTMFQIDGYVSMLVYTAGGVPIPSTYVNGDFYANGTNIGSSYIMGTCYLEQSVLAQTYCYLGLDYFGTPIDIALFDAITGLGWGDDVIIEIAASPSADIISVGNTATTNTYTNPSGATVHWKSSNNSVATVSTAGLITGVGVGDVTITAYILVNGIAVSTSFDMKVQSS